MVLSGGSTISVVDRVGSPSGGTVVGAVRPERMSLQATAGAGECNNLAAVVERRQFLGSMLQYSVRTAANDLWIVEVTNPRGTFDAGETVRLTWAPEDTLLLESDAASADPMQGGDAGFVVPT